jgi:predicted ester cyclase
MALSDEDRLELQKQTVLEHITGENNHDWDRVWETYIRDGRSHFDVVPSGVRYRGFAGVQDFYATFESSFPDFHVNVTASYDVPGYSVREATITATHEGEFAGIEPTGRAISFELAAFYVFGSSDGEAGKLVAERIYYDTESVLRQLRGEAGPTGVGLINDVEALA